MNLRKYLSTMRDYDTDDVLGMIGLQKRSSSDWVFPMLAGIGAGMAIGAGLAMFLTPYRGTEAREKLAKSMSDAQRMLNEKVSMLSDRVASLSSEMKNDNMGTAGAGSTGSMGANMGTSGSIGTGTNIGGNRVY